jgi:glucosamine-6-phosphate deaminase
VKIIVTKNYDEMSAKAADIFAQEIIMKPSGVFGFATGSSPIGLYKELVAKHKAGRLDFSGITSFNLDEYYPIEKSNSQSYDYFMKEQLFNHVNINFSRVFIPNGEAEDMMAESTAFDAKMEAAGGIDMQLLGLGTNGHIGFNEPDEVFSKGTHSVKLAESTIHANARFFSDISQVPRKAITMGIKSIMKARKILLIASGANKVAVVKAFIYGDITPRIPASVLQFHPDVTVVLDEDAAAAISLC